MDRNRTTVSMLAGLAVLLLAACQSTPPAPPAPLSAPTLMALFVPSDAFGNAWSNYNPLTPPPTILPTSGRGVRVMFRAPGGAMFNVVLRALNGSTGALSQKSAGTAAPHEAGFFEIVSENVNKTPAEYVMYVRAPQALADPSNYDIEISQASLRTDVADGPPLVIPLRARRIFTVTVSVTGNGHVTSTPAGIECGTTPQGRTMSPCTFEFGAGTVTLLPGSNDLTSTKFVGWSGNCAPGVQSCAMTLTGAGPMVASAMFGPQTATFPVSTCPTAPALQGLKWVDLPHCATGVLDSHPGISNPALCDSQGYFCCEPGLSGSSHPRCGNGKIFSEADCRHLAPTGTLRQPGGCYEVDTYP